MNKYKYLLCFLAFIILLFLVNLKKDENLNAFNDEFILQETTDEKNLNYEELSFKDEVTILKDKYNNDDIVGIFSILNTDYKVPLVQGIDNDYYLNHLPNKEHNIMGSIFLDYRVDIDVSKKILIYGHNSASYNMPFKILENYYDESYLNNHKYVEIKTTKKSRRYEIFSVFVETTDYSYMKVNLEGKDYLSHLENLKNKSFFNINVELNENTNILILQTCSTHKNYTKYKKKYLIIVLKEIENLENLN